MCGRYRLSRRKQIIEEHFDSISGEEDWVPRYNIAPTQPVPIIRRHPKEPRAEIMQMLRLLPDPARTICAVAAFLGLRRAESRGLEWQDYSGAEIRVMRALRLGVGHE